MTEDNSTEISEIFPITGVREETLFAKVCVCVTVEDRGPDEMLLLHLNQLVGRYDSNIVTFDTSNNRDYWRNAKGPISTDRGFAIGYLGWGKRASIAAELTVAIAKFKPRVATGTSYTDTDKIEFQQHNQRYLSQIGGICQNPSDPITGVSFSTLNNTAFKVESLRAFAL